MLLHTVMCLVTLKRTAAGGQRRKSWVMSLMEVRLDVCTDFVVGSEMIKSTRAKITAYAVLKDSLCMLHDTLCHQRVERRGVNLRLRCIKGSILHQPLELGMRCGSMIATPTKASSKNGLQTHSRNASTQLSGQENESLSCDNNMEWKSLWLQLQAFETCASWCWDEIPSAILREILIGRLQRSRPFARPFYGSRPFHLNCDTAARRDFKMSGS